MQEWRFHSIVLRNEEVSVVIAINSQNEMNRQTNE
jgi:hypothetical protein